MDKLFTILPPELLPAVFAVISLLMVLWAICRYRQALRTIAVSSVMGLCALMLCYFFGEGIGCFLSLNLIHIGTAVILGVPGVLLLLAIRLLP